MAARAFFENMPEVAQMMDCEYEHFRSKIIFFSTGGTPFIRLSPEDLDIFMKRYNITIKEGELPQNKEQVLVTDTALYGGESRMGQPIGKYVGNNALELSDKYKVVGRIASPYNIMLGLLEEKRNLFVVFKEPIGDEVEQVINGHLNLFEKKYTLSETEDLKRLFQRNLWTGDVVAIILLFVQMWHTIENLLEAYFSNQFKEMALFHIVGYNSSRINRLLINRYIAIFGMGGLVGIIGGESAVLFFYFNYCEIRGIYYTLWDPLYILIPLMMLIGLLVLCCNKYMKRLKHINWIQDL